MKFRKLRMAWSVGWCVGCVLLGALWVRSRSSADTAMIQFTKTRAMQLDSARGVVSFESLYFLDDADAFTTEFSTEPISDDEPEMPPSPSGFAWEVARGADGGSHTLFLPHWFSVALFATLAAAPWIRWRFSLRTLLIAVTLVAVVLAFVCYAIG